MGLDARYNRVDAIYGGVKHEKEDMQIDGLGLN